MFVLETDFFKLIMIPLEYEFERIPSFKSDVEFVLKRNSNSVFYKSSRVWISMDDLDFFLKGLLEYNDSCELSDFSGDFVIRVCRDGLSNNFVGFFRNQFAGDGGVELKFDSFEASDFYDKVLYFAQAISNALPVR